MAKAYKARAKKYNKMTRSGMVERNAVTGAEKNISRREQDYSLRPDAPGGMGQLGHNAGRRTNGGVVQPQRTDTGGKQTRRQRFHRQSLPPRIVSGNDGRTAAPFNQPNDLIVYGQLPGGAEQQSQRHDDTPQSNYPAEAAETGVSNQASLNESVTVENRLRDTPGNKISAQRLRRHKSFQKPLSREAPAGEVSPAQLNGTELPLQYNETAAPPGEAGTSFNETATPARETAAPSGLEVNNNESDTGLRFEPPSRQTDFNNHAPTDYTISEPSALSFEKPEARPASTHKSAQYIRPPRIFIKPARLKRKPGKLKHKDAMPDNIKTGSTKPDDIRFAPSVGDIEPIIKEGKFTGLETADTTAESVISVPVLEIHSHDNPVGETKTRGHPAPISPGHDNPSRDDSAPATHVPDIPARDGSAPQNHDPDVPIPANPPPDHAPEPEPAPPKPGRLQFTDEEKTPEASPPPDKELTRLKNRADKYNDKLEQARENLPSTRRIKAVRVFNEEKGKATTKLQFEKEILPRGAGKPFLSKPADIAAKGASGVTHAVTGKLHQKISEVEKENVGTEAGHRAEQAAEAVYRGGRRVTRSALRFIRDKPYRTVNKLEEKALKANTRYSRRLALNDNPKLKSNMFSRYMQKRKIKRQYAKAAREAKRAGTALKNAGDITKVAAKLVTGIIKKNPGAIAVILIILLFVFFIYAMVSSFGTIAGAGFHAVVASSYLAEDSELNTPELDYSEWETDLLMEIDNTELNHPGYDEYIYHVGDIGHDPIEMAAFLTAMYQNFQYADIQSDLRRIFDEQYILSTEESTETRYYTDPDGDSIPYDWRVLTVTLTARPFNEVILEELNAEQTVIFNLLTQTKGNRQYTGSPFDFDWLSRVTSNFGYRVHPISGEKDYHMGVDIAVPAGTEILAGHDGTVTFAGYNSSYGNYVVIEDSQGLSTKYAHCDSLSVSAGQAVTRGEVIALSGNTGSSTGAHLHFEVLKDGTNINPLYFSMTSPAEPD